MSLRGKRDISVTRNLFQSGILEDRRSFATLDGHLMLSGFDKSKVRLKLFKKARGRCAECKRLTGWEGGQWDHIDNVRRCDCFHNGRWLCESCHMKRHPQVQWTPKTEVA